MYKTLYSMLQYSSKSIKTLKAGIKNVQNSLSFGAEPHFADAAHSPCPCLPFSPTEYQKDKLVMIY